MENRADEMTKKNEDLERYRFTMEDKLSKLEKALNEEREKSLSVTLRSQEEKVVGMRVESSLREIQEKLRRDQRERELELARTKLESQIKEMEKKVLHERETWVEALKAQMSKRDLEDHAIEERFGVRVKEMEARLTQERARMAAKMEEKTREVEELKKQLIVKEEAFRGEAEKAAAYDETKRRLDEILNDLDKTQRDREALQTRLQKLEDVRRHFIILREELGRSKAQLAGAQTALKQREAVIRKARLALQAFAKERAQLFESKEKIKMQETRIESLSQVITRAQKERTALAQAAGRKLMESQSQINGLKDNLRNIEEAKNRLELELRREQMDKQIMIRDKQALETEVMQAKAGAAADKRAREEMPIMQRHLDMARQETQKHASELFKVQEELERLKITMAGVQANREKALKDWELAMRQMETMGADVKKREEEWSKVQETKDSHLFGLKTDLNKTLGELKTGREENERLRSELERARKDLESAVVNAHRLLEANTEMNARYQDALRVVETERREAALMRESLNRAQTDLAVTQSRIRDVEEQMKHLEQKASGGSIAGAQGQPASGDLGWMDAFGGGGGDPFGRGGLEKELEGIKEAKKTLEDQVDDLKKTHSMEMDNLRQSYDERLKRLEETFEARRQAYDEAFKGVAQTAQQEPPKGGSPTGETRPEGGPQEGEARPRGGVWDWLNKPI